MVDVVREPHRTDSTRGKKKKKKKGSKTLLYSILENNSWER